MDIGKIGITIDGIYNSEKQYEKLTIVRHNGMVYISKKSTLGNTPEENNQYWLKISESENIDDFLSDISKNPVQNKVITENINTIKGLIDSFGLSVVNGRLCQTYTKEEN